MLFSVRSTGTLSPSRKNAHMTNTNEVPDARADRLHWQTLLWRTLNSENIAEVTQAVDALLRGKIVTFVSVRQHHDEMLPAAPPFPLHVAEVAYEPSAAGQFIRAYDQWGDCHTLAMIYKDEARYVIDADGRSVQFISLASGSPELHALYF
jgi:hypothetical protein